MTLTAGKIFAIGNFVLSTLAGSTAAAALAQAGIPDGAAKLILLLLGVLGMLWNGVGTILLSPERQVQAVAAHIDDPDVKKVVIPAVSELSGLDPLQINSNADATLIALGADRNIVKVLPPKS